MSRKGDSLPNVDGVGPFWEGELQFSTARGLSLLDVPSKVCSLPPVCTRHQEQRGTCDQLPSSTTELQRNAAGQNSGGSLSLRKRTFPLEHWAAELSGLLSSPHGPLRSPCVDKRYHTAEVQGALKVFASHTRCTCAKEPSTFCWESLVLSQCPGCWAGFYWGCSCCLTGPSPFLLLFKCLFTMTGRFRTR